MDKDLEQQFCSITFSIFGTLSISTIHLSPVHKGNFSPVDQDGIQETNPKWWYITLYIVSFMIIVALLTLVT